VLIILFRRQGLLGTREFSWNAFYDAIGFGDKKGGAA
jgi:hypothetical protein